MSEDDDAAFVAPASLPADWARQLLGFWFDGQDEQDWFGGGAAFDAEVARFADWRKALRSQPASAFLTDADTARAAILLFDQVPRNLHRQQAEAFATDSLALAIARGSLDQGYDQGLGDNARAFLYMPFEHSEDIEDQRESVRLMHGISAHYGEFAQKHFDIIDRFGRFPHRNAALGRADRDGEAEAIAEGRNW